MARRGRPALTSRPRRRSDLEAAAALIREAETSAEESATPIARIARFLLARI